MFTSTELQALSLLLTELRDRTSYETCDEIEIDSIPASERVVLMRAYHTDEPEEYEDLNEQNVQKVVSASSLAKFFLDRIEAIRTTPLQGRDNSIETAIKEIAFTILDFMDFDQYDLAPTVHEELRNILTKLITQSQVVRVVDIPLRLTEEGSVSDDDLHRLSETKQVSSQIL